MSIVTLHHRCILTLKGPDRHSLLQGLITHDIHRLKKTPILFTALLSPQGRFLHDFFVIEEGDTLYLTPEKNRINDLKSKLMMYKLRSKVDIDDRQEDLALVACFNESPPTENVWYQDPRLQDMGYIALRTQSNTLDTKTLYDSHRIALGIPDGSLDLTIDKSVILEYNYNELNALDWNKGCYLGQELMSRTFHRGLIRKRLLPVHLDSTPPTFGESILLEGKKIGTLRSTLDHQGLALLRIEETQKAMSTKTPLLTEGGITVTPQIPSFLKPILK